MLLIVKYHVGKKVFTDERKAEEYALKTRQSIKKSFIPLGCLYFCEVADFCPQWQALLELSSKS